MRKASIVYLRLSFRADDFYIEELFAHLANLKTEKEISLEIKKILFNRSRLDIHNKFQREESELPKCITFRVHISERELHLNSVRELILASPKEKRVHILKRIIFDAYNQSPPQKSPAEYSSASKIESQRTSTHAKYDIEPAATPSTNERSSIPSNNEEKNDSSFSENSTGVEITSIQVNTDMKSRTLASLGKFNI